MPKLKNSSQKKEQEKVMARGLNETDISNMLVPEFKVTIIRILAGLEKSMKDIRKTLNIEIKELENNQAEMKNAITEIQNRLVVMTTKRSRGMEK